MQEFDYLDHKINYLKDSPYQDLLRESKQHIAGFIRARKALNRLFSEGIQSVFVVDLIYLYHRHWSWHHAPLFSEFVIDFLNRDYALPRDDATALVEELFDLYNSLVPFDRKHSPAELNREFLKELLLCAAITKNQRALMIDLGFGRGMLKILTDAGQFDSKEELFCFEEDLQADLAQTLKELDEEITSNQEMVELYRFRIYLQRQSPTDHLKLDFDHLKLLNEVLLEIGLAGKRLSELIANLSSIDRHAEDITTAILTLDRYQCIYSENQHGDRQSRLQLTGKGLQLIAKKFVWDQLRLSSEKNLIVDFPKLPELIQLQYLQTCKPDQALLFKLLQATMFRLKPATLEKFSQQITNQSLQEEMVDLLQELLHNSQNPWLRATACKLLGAYRDEKTVRENLLTSSSNDASPMVRRQAKKALSDAVNQKGD